MPCKTRSRVSDDYYHERTDTANQGKLLLRSVNLLCWGHGRGAAASFAHPFNRYQMSCYFF